MHVPFYDRSSISIYDPIFPPRSARKKAHLFRPGRAARAPGAAAPRAAPPFDHSRRGRRPWRCDGAGAPWDHGIFASKMEVPLPYLRNLRPIQG